MYISNVRKACRACYHLVPNWLLIISIDWEARLKSDRNRTLIINDHRGINMMMKEKEPRQ